PGGGQCHAHRHAGVRRGHRAGRRGGRPVEHVLDLQRHHGRGLHHESTDRRHHGRGGQLRRLHRRGLDPGSGRKLRVDLRRPQPDHGRQLCHFPAGAHFPTRRPVREGRGMSPQFTATTNRLSRSVGQRRPLPLLLFALSILVLAMVPLWGNDYITSLFISLMMYANLATAWGVFCGTTRRISLATAAFVGVGCYSVALLGEMLPWPLVLAAAALAGGLLALLIGVCTLRLSGMYFVIFTFGVAEMILQLVTWYESTVQGSVGRFIFLEVSTNGI